MNLGGKALKTGSMWPDTAYYRRYSTVWLTLIQLPAWSRATAVQGMSQPFPRAHQQRVYYNSFPRTVREWNVPPSTVTSASSAWACLLDSAPPNHAEDPRCYIHGMLFLSSSMRMSRRTNYVPSEPQHDKTNKVNVRPAKTQISLGIRPVWSESSLYAWRKLGSLATHWAQSEDSDQTGRMPRLIWVFAGRTVTLLVLSCRGSFNVPGKKKKNNNNNSNCKEFPRCVWDFLFCLLILA